MPRGVDFWCVGRVFGLIFDMSVAPRDFIFDMAFAPRDVEFICRSRLGALISAVSVARRGLVFDASVTFQDINCGYIDRNSGR